MKMGYGTEADHCDRVRRRWARLQRGERGGWDFSFLQGPSPDNVDTARELINAFFKED